MPIGSPLLWPTITINQKQFLKEFDKISGVGTKKRIIDM